MTNEKKYIQITIINVFLFQIQFKLFIHILVELKVNIKNIENLQMGKLEMTSFYCHGKNIKFFL